MYLQVLANLVAILNSKALVSNFVGKIMDFCNALVICMNHLKKLQHIHIHLMKESVSFSNTAWARSRQIPTHLLLLLLGADKNFAKITNICYL